MSAAPSWPLISSPFKGARLPKRDCRHARIVFRSISKAGGALQGPLSPEFVLQTFKTQNDVRGADAHPPVRSISSRTAKARNCLISQRLVERHATAPTARRAFVLPSRYGMTIVKNREESPRIPTHFRVLRALGRPFARLLLCLRVAGQKREARLHPNSPAILVFGRCPRIAPRSSGIFRQFHPSHRGRA